MRVFLVLLVVVASSSSPSFGQNQDCIDRWETATQAGIVYGVGFIDGQATVEVDEATWHTLPFETRVGIVDTLICAALPEGKTGLMYQTHQRCAE